MAADQPPDDATGQPPPTHVGSPFAENSGAAREVLSKSLPPLERSARRLPGTVPRLAAYPRHVAAAGGAVASVVLGVLSGVGATLTPAGAIVTALLGIAMGIWGLYGRRRRLAIAGLVLCCLVLVFSGFLAAIWLYEASRGVSPWELDAADGDPFVDW